MVDYEIDTRGNEDEIVARETALALNRHVDAVAYVALTTEVPAFVRIILALLAAIGAKSVREALSKAKGWAAPVDVEKQTREAVANALRRWDAVRAALGPASIVRDERAMEAALMPLVADRARLARELAGCEATASDLAEQLVAARAEIESLTRGVTHHMTVAAIHRAEIARLTAALTEHRAALDAVKDLGRGYAAARDRAVDAVASGTASPGEAWGRLREWVSQERGKAEAEHGKARIKAVDKLIAFAVQEAFRAVGERMAALAAVEPRGEPTGEAWVLPGYVGPGGCNGCGNDPGRRHASGCEGAAEVADPSAPVETRKRRGIYLGPPPVGVEAITHDFRPGAQDGMPRLADVEARERAASTPAHLMTRAELDVEIDRQYAERAKARRAGVPFDRARLDALLQEAADRIPLPSLTPGQIAPRWPLCVDCSTGPQTQRVPTEARPTGRCARCGNGGIMYAPRDEAAELARRAAAAKRAQKEG